MDPPVVIDGGSAYFRAGISGNMVPTSLFDSVVGKPKVVGVHAGMAANDRYVGDEALTKRLVLDLEWPIQRGVITNWDAYDKLLKYAYSEIGVHSQEQPILLGEGMFVPDDQRPKLAELCFEKFGVPSFFQASEAVLATYGSGSTAALVLDFGEHKTEIVPVTDGMTSAVLFGANTRLPIGGAELTDELVKTLRQNGYNFNTQAEREIVRDMKEKLCYVAYDFNEEQKLNKPKASYTLPDGQVIRFGFQRFQVPESYFRPEVVGLEDSQGLHQLITKALQDHPEMLHLRRYLAENCIITGGSSCLPGLAERIKKELLTLSPVNADGDPKWEVKVNAPEHRKYSVWFGGSLLGPFTNFVSREKYDEMGPTSVALEWF